MKLCKTQGMCVNWVSPRTAATQGNEDAIVASVEREPWRSSRDIALELVLSQSTVFEVDILHNNQLHLYHYSRSAHLFPDGRPICMQFCKWAQQHAADELASRTLLWVFIFYLIGWVLKVIVIFLKLFYPGLLEDVPVAVGRRLWFEHDGGAVHYTRDVREWLNATYPGR